MRRFACILISSVLLCGLLCPPVSNAQEPQAQTSVADRYADKIRTFEEYVRASMPKDRIPGMTVGFTWSGYTWVEGFGYADLENKSPAKPESAYRLASITKSMTGEAIVQLAERGKLDLDAEIQKYVPDYVRLYKSDSSVPKQLRFTPAFEKLIERWDADWSRTWNDYTRSLAITPATDFDAVGARLRKEFANAEVYPDFVVALQPLQQGMVALKAPKLGVELYPYSDELLFNLAYYIITFEQVEGGHAAIKAVVPDHEPPAAYLRRAYEANPDGVMSARTFLDIGAGWLKRPERINAGVEFLGAAAGLHTKDAAVQEMFGDFLVRAGRKDEAAAQYRKAFALDPNIAKGSTLDAYLASKTAPAPASTPKP
jgi:tetratricopeptide (TPR) repeat protein